jgi:hypothetical protein
VPSWGYMHWKVFCQAGTSSVSSFSGSEDGLCWLSRRAFASAIERISFMARSSGSGAVEEKGVSFGDLGGEEERAKRMVWMSGSPSHSFELGIRCQRGNYSESGTCVPALLVGSKAFLRSASLGTD